MGLIYTALWLSYALNAAFESYKTLKPVVRGRHPGPSRTTVSRRRDVKRALMKWVCWAVWCNLEGIADRTVSWLPLYTQLKFLVLFWFLFSRSAGAEYIYTTLLKSALAPYEPPLDVILEVFSDAGEILFYLLSAPFRTALARWKASRPPLPPPDEPLPEPQAVQQQPQQGRVRTAMRKANAASVAPPPQGDPDPRLRQRKRPLTRPPAITTAAPQPPAREPTPPPADPEITAWRGSPGPAFPGGLPFSPIVVTYSRALARDSGVVERAFADEPPRASFASRGSTHLYPDLADLSSSSLSALPSPPPSAPFASTSTSTSTTTTTIRKKRKSSPPPPDPELLALLSTSTTPTSFAAPAPSSTSAPPPTQPARGEPPKKRRAAPAVHPRQRAPSRLANGSAKSLPPALSGAATLRPKRSGALADPSAVRRVASADRMEVEVGRFEDASSSLSEADGEEEGMEVEQEEQERRTSARRRGMAGVTLRGAGRVRRTGTGR